MEFDVFVEDLKLAVEYQGIQHYKPLYHQSADLECQMKRDEEKRQNCKKVP